MPLRRLIQFSKNSAEYFSLFARTAYNQTFPMFHHKAFRHNGMPVEMPKMCLCYQCIEVFQPFFIFDQQNEMIGGQRFCACRSIELRKALSAGQFSEPFPHTSCTSSIVHGAVMVQLFDLKMPAHSIQRMPAHIRHHHTGQRKRIHYRIGEIQSVNLTPISYKRYIKCCVVGHNWATAHKFCKCT